MEIYLDSANIDALKRYKSLVAGITTNPAIMAKEGARQEQRLKELADLAPTLPISGEVVYANSREQIIQDATEIAKIAPNIVVKIPGNMLGLSCIPDLKAKGLKLNITALMTFKQLALAAMLGADYISQFFCRARDAGVNSAREVDLAREFVEREELPAKIIIGSVRTPDDVESALQTGGHIITISPELIENTFTHEKTQPSIDEFAHKYEAALEAASRTQLQQLARVANEMRP